MAEQGENSAHFYWALLRVSGVGLASWPNISTPRRSGPGRSSDSSAVDDAEGRVREQVGEEKIGGSERDGTPKRDMI